MIKTVLLIPMRSNQGGDFPRATWKSLEERLVTFGGFTRMPGVVGVWRDGNRTYRDRSRQYVVSLASWMQLTEWLAVVQWALTAFDQEALYIEVAGVPEIISRPREPMPGNARTDTRK